MTTLREEIHGTPERLERLRRCAEQFSDAEAWRRPTQDSWCLMELLSHIIGPAEEPMLAGITRALIEDTPTLLAGSGESFLESARLGASPEELRGAATESLRAMMALGESLSDEQIARTVRIPWLAGSPLGETPTIGNWLSILLTYHLDDHLEHLEALAGDLGIASRVA